MDGRKERRADRVSKVKNSQVKSAVETNCTDFVTKKKRALPVKHRRVVHIYIHVYVHMYYTYICQNLRRIMIYQHIVRLYINTLLDIELNDTSVTLPVGVPSLEVVVCTMIRTELHTVLTRLV